MKIGIIEAIVIIIIMILAGIGITTLLFMYLLPKLIVIAREFDNENNDWLDEPNPQINKQKLSWDNHKWLANNWDDDDWLRDETKSQKVIKQNKISSNWDDDIPF